MGDRRPRPAGPADAEAIASVMVATWRAAYRGLMPQPFLDGMDVARYAALWTRQLAAGPDRHAFVVEPDGEMAGFASGGPERERDPAYSGELYALYVLPGHQRRGHGRALLQAVARALVADARTSMLVWVLRDNRPARDFYERLGGSFVRERPLDFGAGFELVEAGYGWPDVREIVER